MNLALPRKRTPRRGRGFSLVELLVAMSLGLLLIIAVLSVYLSGNNAFRRTEELGELQNGARTTFEYIGFDTKMAGMLGCQAGISFLEPSIATTFLSDYAVGLEGYNASGDPTFSLTGTNVSSEWSTNTNTAGGGTSQLPFNTTGSGLPNAISAGSDVLVLRGPATPIALRLTEAANATTVKIESATVAGSSCQNETTAASGLCTGSHMLVSDCQNAKVVGVGGLASAPPVVTLTLAGDGLGGATVFPIVSTEVFPMQTVVYYVAPSVNNPTVLALYRHVFNGTNNSGARQELIEGVENLQIEYGEDESVDPDRDYTADAYRVANEVDDWSKVISVRIGVLVRPLSPMAPDAASPSSAPVLGVNAEFPDTRFDRRVFTSTVTLRNRIPYTPAP